MAKKTMRNFDGMTMKLRSHSRKEQPMCPPANIQTLPEEVMIEIFSYLSLGELCNTVSKVCTQWERLHWDRQLYNWPKILEGKGNMKGLIDCLQEVQHLASPHFDQVYIKEIIDKCLETRVKPVKRWPRTGELKDLIMILSHSTEVNLNGTIRTAHPWILDPDFFRCCVQLEELKVGVNNGIYITQAELISLCDQLCGTLRVLHLDHCRWTLEEARALTKCRFLEDLAIHKGYELTNESLLEISNMSSIRRLSIVRSAFLIAEQTCIRMLSNKALDGLTHLHLDNFTYSPEVAVAIGTNLINLTDLFIFSSLYIRNGVATGVRSIIKGCNKLNSLQFKCSGRYTVVNDILMIPTFFPRLKTLAVSVRRSNSNYRNWRAILKEKMPDLVIRELVG